MRGVFGGWIRALAVLPFLASCLEDLPAPLPAGADGGAASSCPAPTALPTINCNGPVNSIDPTDSCFNKKVTEQCLLEPTKLSCDSTCEPAPPGCRERCSPAVTARAPKADCSPPHTDALGFANGMTDCYLLLCPRPHCMDACDNRGFVIGASKYSNLDEEVIFRSDLGTRPESGQLGVHIRLRGLVGAALKVYAGPNPVRTYPLSPSSTTDFIDLILFDETPEGPYRWSKAADAPTRVTLERPDDAILDYLEIDCITPFYLPP
jgi:hypothetical protein